MEFLRFQRTESVSGYMGALKRVLDMREDDEDTVKFIAVIFTHLAQSPVLHIHIASVLPDLANVCLRTSSDATKKYIVRVISHLAVQGDAEMKVRHVELMDIIILRNIQRKIIASGMIPAVISIIRQSHDEDHDGAIHNALIIIRDVAIADDGAPADSTHREWMYTSGINSDLLKLTSESDNRLVWLNSAKALSNIVLALPDKDVAKLVIRAIPALQRTAMQLRPVPVPEWLTESCRRLSLVAYVHVNHCFLGKM